MTFEQILSDIHNKKYAPIYFLMGEEPYFIDVISDTIEEEVLDEAEKAFNQIVVYGRDVDIDTVATHAKSFSMMGGYMVVIVKEAQDLKNIEDFEKYLDVIPSTTILVFDYKYKKLDKRRALAKKIDKMGVLFESKKLYENNIPGWIQSYLSDKGYSIEDVLYLQCVRAAECHRAEGCYECKPDCELFRRQRERQPAAGHGYQPLWLFHQNPEGALCHRSFTKCPCCHLGRQSILCQGLPTGGSQLLHWGLCQMYLGFEGIRLEIKRLQQWRSL